MQDIHESLIRIPDLYMNRGNRLQRAVSEGRHIPERLLPGRLLSDMKSDFRNDLIKTDFLNVAPWWIKIACS